MQKRRLFHEREGGTAAAARNLVLLLAEQVCDWCLCVVLWQSGRSVEACFLAGILVVSHIVQVLSVRFYTLEGPHATVAALFGLKVCIESRRTMKREAPAHERRFFDSCNFAVTRA